MKRIILAIAAVVGLAACTAKAKQVNNENANANDNEKQEVMTKAEKEANARPAIKGKVENMEQYDLKGKTVIPFCTAYGICIVTKELGGQGMESKTAKIDKWLGEIGF